MSLVVRTSSVRNDLKEIGRYIARQSQSLDLAMKFLDRVEQKCRLYAAHPEMGVPRTDLGASVRCFSVSEYVVFYEPHRSGIRILLVTHGSRDVPTVPDDRNHDGVIDLRDVDANCAALLGGTATRDEIDGFFSRQNTGPGDANFDHLFDSSDLVSVFQRGKYETNSPASWSDGDWNCDGVFGSADLVAAFQRGWYEAGPLNAVAAGLR